MPSRPKRAKERLSLPAFLEYAEDTQRVEEIDDVGDKPRSRRRDVPGAATKIVRDNKRGSSKKEPSLFELLEERWRHGALLDAEDCVHLGTLALARRDYDLACRVLAQAVYKMKRDGVRGARKSLFKDAQTCLLYAEMMAQESGAAERSSRNTQAPPPISPPVSGSPKRREPASRKRHTQSKGVSSMPAASRTNPAPSPPSAHATDSSDAATFADGLFVVDVPPLAAPQDAEISVHFEITAQPVIEALQCSSPCGLAGLDLAMQAYRHSFRVSYDQLICLATLRNVQSLWYQEETARKVMTGFRGRAVLADEVGLGKTIEACLVLKEYLMRGLVRSALILTPSSLVNQWQEELREKFDLEFISSNDTLFRQDPKEFWSQPFIVASLHAAKLKHHCDLVVSRSYDLVIVDEAHHLKNQRTKAWQLLNGVKNSFLLLLTATPVQNNLGELYNLVTVLKPGHLKTRKAFDEEFVTRGNPTDPRNRERLRGLLKEIMIRNTRSVTSLHLPPRFAVTTQVAPSEVEDQFYRLVSSLVSEHSAEKSRSISTFTMRRLLEAAGSSHWAAIRTMERLRDQADASLQQRLDSMVDLGTRIGLGSKAGKVLDIIRSTTEPVIVFVNYRATLEAVHKVLREARIATVVFHGGLNPAAKQHAIEEFRRGGRVLLATGTGGEGHNLQFCHVMINYDLPWNPMEIEQRIGRIHRIGQEKEVLVYNFCAKGSIEDRILDVLDRKINMFELVVGEIDMILGRLQDDQDFADMIFDIWTRHPDETARAKAFDAFGARLQKARRAHQQSKEFDEKLFREDFGV
ncbi:MAG: SNF2-related protein [Thermodesulfobacteriota bacterium]